MAYRRLSRLEATWREEPPIRTAACLRAKKDTRLLSSRGKLKVRDILLTLLSTCDFGAELFHALDMPPLIMTHTLSLPEPAALSSHMPAA